jgi:hypothetical protein
VGALLTADQVGWLYGIQTQAAGQRRRVSHSELVRLAIDRLRRDNNSRHVAEQLVDAAAPADGEYSSYALAADQVGWLREVKGYAFLAGRPVSQADIIRTAMRALAGLSWRDLRSDVDR